jgi:hypothetical protein
MRGQDYVVLSDDGHVAVQIDGCATADAEATPDADSDDTSFMKTMDGISGSDHAVLVKPTSVEPERRRENVYVHSSRDLTPISSITTNPAFDDFFADESVDPAIAENDGDDDDDDGDVDDELEVANC